ncbi:MAG: type II toxin-antitoxin system HicB family antitoxin [Spirochaetales bacterium]|jgi:predicted RNase H-like HicB family nuclease|nr:type II toxin-antitoxin system HicB family antitoxin [Spirochaetales bacterium]
MTRHFPIIVEQDIDGVFIVGCPVLQGCRSYGNSMHDALANIREAIELCLEDETVTPEDSTVFVGIRDIEMVV